MLALARASRANNLHVADWPYRLASWAFDQPENAARWVDDAGELLAWAALQAPFWAIDYVMRPDAESSALHRSILAWADERARAVAGTRFGRPAWYVGVLAHQAGRRRDLEAAGFADQVDAGENAWSKVLMARDAVSHRPVALPPGFAIRPLDGQREVEAYVALHRAVFESENMTIAWRLRTLRQAAYRPGNDLVLQAPDGELAGFCVGWLDGDAGQIEPMGIRADARGRGLGMALLSECVRRLGRSGATRVFVETDNYRDAAFALYQSAGFRVEHEVRVYRKDYP
jgi:ribosomal protein S18 acetylase RimI-like enzyme